MPRQKYWKKRVLGLAFCFLAATFPLHVPAQVPPDLINKLRSLNSGMVPTQKPVNSTEPAVPNSGKVSTGASGTTANVYSMSYQVHVLGQVQGPGTYRMGPSVRVAEAIAMAGGIADSGSQRHIELRRWGEVTRRIDLLRFIREGDLNENPFLQDNDVLFVPYLRQSVRIEGPVKKGGVYELANEKSVWDIVKLAGGFASGVAETGDVAVVRYGENEKKEILKVATVRTELERTPIQSRDIIVVPHIFTKDKKFDYSFAALPGDNVFYPSHSDSVHVLGAVGSPGPQDYNGLYNVREYVNLAGPGERAKLKSMRVLTADGRVIRNTKKYKLSPGDTIIVPEKKLTTANFLSWYNTFASTVFTGVALKSLAESF